MKFAANRFSRRRLAGRRGAAYYDASANAGSNHGYVTAGLPGVGS